LSEQEKGVLQIKGCDAALGTRKSRMLVLSKRVFKLDPKALHSTTIPTEPPVQPNKEKPR
jgi:hypothetical protein